MALVSSSPGCLSSVRVGVARTITSRSPTITTRCVPMCARRSRPAHRHHGRGLGKGHRVDSYPQSSLRSSAKYRAHAELASPLRRMDAAAHDPRGSLDRPGDHRVGRGDYESQAPSRAGRPIVRRHQRHGDDLSIECVEIASRRRSYRFHTYARPVFCRTAHKRTRKRRTAADPARQHPWSWLLPLTQLDASGNLRVKTKGETMLTHPTHDRLVALGLPAWPRRWRSNASNRHCSAQPRRGSRSWSTAKPSSGRTRGSSAD